MEAFCYLSTVGNDLVAYINTIADTRWSVIDYFSSTLFYLMSALGYGLRLWFPLETIPGL